MKHAVLGASSSKRWMHCPGSVRMCVGVPSTTSEFAQEGTAAHELAERCLRKNRPAAHYLGDAIMVDGTAFEVTPGMADGVQVYLDEVTRQVEEYEFLTDVTVEIEKQFDLDWLGAGLELYGTNDSNVQAVGIRLVVLDYKNGFQPVNAVEPDGEPNSQLAYYGLGALGPGNPKGFQDVELVVVQPNGLGPAVKRHVMPVDALYAWGRGTLVPAARATEDPNAPLRAGDWCRFCPALAKCPETKTYANEMAAIAFQAEAAPVKLDGALIPPVEDLTPEEVGRALDLAEIIEPWLKAVRERAESDLARGIDVTGYKRVNTRASYSWVDESRATSALFGILKSDAYAKPKLLTVAQAKKAITTKFKEDKEKQKTALQAIEAVIKETRGVTVAKISDRREALPSAIQAFTAVDDPYDL